MEVLKNQKRLFLFLEVLAVLFGLAYTILYIQEIQECFVFAFVGAAIYAFLCYKKQIFAESFLQFFYILFAIYGWFTWGGQLNYSYSNKEHLFILLGTALVTVLVGYFLKKNTDSKLPYLDSFTTIFSLTATWLMVNFIHETWLYFIAINTISMFLYYRRGMKLSVFLYLFYVVLSIAGWYKWELFF